MLHSSGRWTRFKRTLGEPAIPIHLPIGSEKGFRGIVDLVDLKAYEYEPNGSGKAKVIDIPSGYAGCRFERA